MRGERPRRGSALIEALIAVMLLAMSGTAFVALVGQTRHTIADVHASEVRTRTASAQLARLSTLRASELAALTGRGYVRGWWLTVDRSSPDLFDVSVAESDTTAVLVRTTLYRPDSTRDITP